MSRVNGFAAADHAQPGWHYAVLGAPAIGSDALSVCDGALEEVVLLVVPFGHLILLSYGRCCTNLRRLCAARAWQLRSLPPTRTLPRRAPERCRRVRSKSWAPRPR